MLVDNPVMALFHSIHHSFVPGLNRTYTFFTNLYDHRLQLPSTKPSQIIELLSFFKVHCFRLFYSLIFYIWFHAHTLIFKHVLKFFCRICKETDITGAA